MLILSETVKHQRARKTFCATLIDARAVGKQTYIQSLEAKVSKYKKTRNAPCEGKEKIRGPVFKNIIQKMIWEAIAKTQ